METATFTIAQLINEVIRLANENPNYVYPAKIDEHRGRICSYLASEEQPACIFGKAIANLGVQLQDWHDGTGIVTVLRNLGVQFNGHQELWMKSVQNAQDGGVPWGTALKSANQNWPGVLDTSVIG